MQEYPGYVDRKGRTYFRCGECGDSTKSPGKAHAFVDLNGRTHCNRCGHNGAIDLEAWIELITNTITVEEAIAWEPRNTLLIPRKTEGRHTLLTKFEEADGTESFAMRDATSRLIGWHTRHIEPKGSHNEGRRGIDWPDSENRCLTSSPSSPILLVEGPYDVITEQSVASYGTCAYATMRYLQAQYVWVQPDPDVIETKAKRRQFVRTLELANANLCFVQGIIVGNDDPDKATVQHKVTLQEAIRYVRNEAG